jgi:glycosyltransferase involved in cell wall biosynthesis
MTSLPSPGDVPAHEHVFRAPRRSAWLLVIPVINEGPRLHRLLGRIQRLGLDRTLDVCVVDGGSSDGSVAADALRPFGVHTLIVKTGPGRLSAQLRCAYAHALASGYAGVVTIDGNDKDDPAAIPAFVDAMANGVDFVQGSRFVPGGVAENTPLLRHLAIRGLHAPLLRLASGFPWTDTTQGFRAYSRRLLEHPGLSLFRDVFDSYELLAHISARAPRRGLRCVELPTARRYPKGEVPTKISTLRGNARVLRILLKACVGAYDPR